MPFYTTAKGTDGYYQLLNPSGSQTQLKGVSLTGPETGTMNSYNGAGVFLMESSMNNINDDAKVKVIMYRLVQALKSEWQAQVVRVPFCISAWAQNYELVDPSGYALISYQDYIDYIVGAIRAQGMAVILDNHSMAMAESTCSDGTHADGCLTSVDTTCASTDFYESTAKTCTVNGNAIQCWQCSAVGIAPNCPSKISLTCAEYADHNPFRQQGVDSDYCYLAANRNKVQRPRRRVLRVIQRTIPAHLLWRYPFEISIRLEHVVQ
jgi:hypothetical protein